jgi:hypothetical protein
MTSGPGRIIPKDQAAGMLAEHIYAATLRRLAGVMAADIEGDRKPAMAMRAWLTELDPRTDALIMIAVSMAGQLGYTPDGLRQWAARHEPRRQVGWRP